jgi:uncharacterized membrane protein YcjF (UPF0283 family)
VLESGSPLNNTVGTAVCGQIGQDGRLLCLLLLAVVDLIAYAGVIVGIVHVWHWIGAHFSSVELLTVAAVIVMASQTYMRLRRLRRRSARKELSFFVLI